MIKRIYLFISSPTVMILSWVVFMLTPFLGIVRLKILVDPNWKLFHISGLSTLLYYAPFAISLVVLAIMIFWFREFAKGRLTALHLQSFSFISVLTVAFLFFSQYLINREFMFYPNYLYEHLGITIIQLKSMSFVAALQIMIFLAFFVYRSTYKSNKSIFSKTNKIKKLSIFDNISLLAELVGILSLFILSGSTFLNWNVLRAESREGYEGKVGVDYKYINMMVVNTPSDSTIIHPPQGDKWPAIGNQPVLRYFLYPRTLVSGSLLDKSGHIKEINSAYFIVIDPEGDREWPTIDLSKKTVIFNELDEIKYIRLTLFYKNDISKIYKIDF